MERNHKEKLSTQKQTPQESKFLLEALKMQTIINCLAKKIDMLSANELDYLYKSFKLLGSRMHTNKEHNYKTMLQEYELERVFSLLHNLLLAKEKLDKDKDKE